MAHSKRTRRVLVCLIELADLVKHEHFCRFQIKFSNIMSGRVPRFWILEEKM
jgi:hypothetical protein